MDYLFLLGRILYGGFFVNAGINHFRHLGMLAGFAGFKGVPAPKAAVAGSGVLILLGGASIVSGFCPAIGVVFIALFLVPVTLTMHSFWTDSDPQMKMMNRVNFEKNLALLGAGLTFLMVPRPWPFSL